ncbi:unnamed protein product [Brachionus calyciflorus]|uniref:Uncharacterized protein n=1 Tax=Brachionus calyciflorus TaxID=104777 RepID=A0A814AY88_9BILA|nr:unnamed protein product [Brachionus calyciflorus]
MDFYITLTSGPTKHKPDYETTWSVQGNDQDDNTVELDDSQIEEKNDPTHQEKIIKEIFVPDRPTLLGVCDLKDELMRFSMEYEDRNRQRDVQQEEQEEETMEQIDEPHQIVVMVKIIWEELREKQDRYGVSYNEAEMTKNQARNEMMDELCCFDPSYNLYRSQMID